MKISWSWFDTPTHVALFLGSLAISAASVILYLTLVPPDARASFQGWLGPLLIALTGSGVGGGLATMLGGRASSQRGSSGPSSSGPSGGAAAVLVLVLASSGLLHACGMTAAQRQGLAVVVLEDLTAGGSVAEQTAERADEQSSCPTSDPTCIAQVDAHWHAADIMIEQMHDAIDVLKVALQAASEASTDPGAAVLDALRAAVLAYHALEQGLAEVGITIPPLPASIEEALSILTADVARRVGQQSSLTIEEWSRARAIAGALSRATRVAGAQVLELRRSL